MASKWKELLDRNMKYYIINGILFGIMQNLYKPFAVKFLQRMGGDEFHISLFNALPGLVAVFTILPASMWVRRFERKKWVTVSFFFLSRLFVLSFAFVPFIPDIWRPIVFVILIGLMNFPESISQSALQSFSGDLFSPQQRSTAISSRNKYSVPATLIITLISGQILTRLPSTEAQRILVYQIFFIIAFTVGLFEIYSFTQMEERVIQGAKKLRFKEAMGKIIKDKPYWGFVICSLIFHFGWQMGWPLMSIYQINYLLADEAWLGIIGISSSIASFYGYNYWNRVIQKQGNSKAIIIITAGMAGNTIITAISPNLYFLTALSVLSGFFTSGTVTILLNALLEVTPDEDRVLYVGVYNTLISISLAISPFVGHSILEATNIYVALVVVSFLRLMGSGAFYIRNKIRVQN